MVYNMTILKATDFSESLVCFELFRFISMAIERFQSWNCRFWSQRRECESSEINGGLAVSKPAQAEEWPS